MNTAQIVKFIFYGSEEGKSINWSYNLNHTRISTFSLYINFFRYILKNRLNVSVRQSVYFRWAVNWIFPQKFSSIMLPLFHVLPITVVNVRQKFSPSFSHCVSFSLFRVKHHFLLLSWCLCKKWDLTTVLSAPADVAHRSGN